MKKLICLLMIFGTINVTIGLLFGRGRVTQPEQHIVKHLHRHEIKIIHEGSGFNEGGGQIGDNNFGGGSVGDGQFNNGHDNGGGNDALFLLNGLNGGGGSVEHGGFGQNTGVFNNGGVFNNNYGSGPDISHGNVGGIVQGSGVVGSVPTQIISIVEGTIPAALPHGVNKNRGFTGSQIVGFIEEGHARGFGGGHTHGGHTHGASGGLTAPQLVELVEQGHVRGFGGGHAHGADDGFTDEQIVSFVEEGHARGYGGGHSHGRLRQFTAPEIASFVEDGYEHGYGGRHSYSHRGNSINGALSSIIGLVEDEHEHVQNNNVGFSQGGGNQIIEVLHGNEHQNSIDYNGHQRSQQIVKIIRDDHSINGHNSFNGNGGGEDIKIVKVIAENRRLGHGDAYLRGGGHNWKTY